MSKKINTYIQFLFWNIVVEIIIIVLLAGAKLQIGNIILGLIGIYYFLKIMCMLIDLKLGPKTEVLKYKKVVYVFSGKDELWNLINSKNRIIGNEPIDRYKDETMINGKVEFEKEKGKNKQKIQLKIMCPAKEIKELTKGKQTSEVTYYKVSHIIKNKAK